MKQLVAGTAQTSGVSRASHGSLRLGVAQWQSNGLRQRAIEGFGMLSPEPMTAPLLARGTSEYIMTRNSGHIGKQSEYPCGCIQGGMPEANG
jgi:hypothetical protein